MLLRRAAMLKALLGLDLLFCALALVGCSTNTLPQANEEGSTGNTVTEAETAGMTVQQTSSRFCSTTAVRGLSRELIAEMQCVRPGQLVSIEGSGVSASDGVYPFLQSDAADALASAIGRRGGTIHITSALRTLPQQLLLYRWYQAGRCGIGLAAQPGHSNHESGLALDTSDYSSWRSVLASQGFSWGGSPNPVHFSHSGTDLRSVSVLAFQRLYNRAHPEDRIAEDGVYGSHTEARLLAAPANGYGIGSSCGPTPTMDDAGMPTMTDDGAMPVMDDAGTDSDAGPPPPPPPPADCSGARTCSDCGAISGCSWCGSAARCQAAGGECVLPDSSCGPVNPCASASCWSPSLTLPMCGTTSVDQDFTSGRYGIHRWSMAVQPGGPIDISVTRTSGSWSPALVITDSFGGLVYGGEIGSPNPNVSVTAGTASSVTLEPHTALDLSVYVTGTDIVAANFSGMLPTSAHYHLSATQSCASMPPPPPPPGGSNPYLGLDESGQHIPRAGLSNNTLRGALGVSVEPYGSVVSADGHDWVDGKLSWFGGPNDTGVSSTETGSVSGEVLRSLNNPLHPSASYLASHLDSYYFCAMRWDYSPNGVTWWRSARIEVVNPRTGARIVVRPVDWGPNTSTRRIIDLSPQSLVDLGVTTDDTVNVAFAAPGTPLGPVP